MYTPCNTRLHVRLQAMLLEHNVRFGDPECQGLMARLERCARLPPDPRLQRRRARRRPIVLESNLATRCFA